MLPPCNWFPSCVVFGFVLTRVNTISHFLNSFYGESNDCRVSWNTYSIYSILCEFKIASEPAWWRAASGMQRTCRDCCVIISSAVTGSPYASAHTCLHAGGINVFLTSSTPIFFLRVLDNMVSWPLTKSFPWKLFYKASQSSGSSTHSSATCSIVRVQSVFRVWSWCDWPIVFNKKQLD